MNKIASIASLATAYASDGAAPAQAPAKAKQERVAPIMTGIHALAIPEAVKTPRGSKSPYPFDTLEVGTAFGLKNKSAKSMSSIVSNQNRKDSNHTPKRDTEGNVVYKMTEMKDTNGNVTKVPTSEPETVQIKEFRAYDVTPEYAKQLKGTPLEGSKVVIFRVR